MTAPFRWLILSILCCASVAIAEAGERAMVAEGIAPAAPIQPQLHIDSKQRVHLTYAVGDAVFYSQSRDGAKSFTAPVQLPPAHDISLGMRRGPRIAATGNAICITVIGGRQGKGKDGDLLAFRSVDAGKSWLGPVLVNDASDAAREGLHAMAAGPKGELCSVWLDLRERGTQVMSATSKDGGETWSNNVVVYRSPAGNVCECCHPSVVYDAHGKVHVLWRNWLGGARDMYSASSNDGGKSFAEAQKLGSESWMLKACPMDGGAIAVGPKDAIATVWRRKKQVFLTADSTGQEALLGEGEQPWVAMTTNGPAAVWLAKRGGSLFYKAPEQAPADLADHAADPVIAASPDGNLVVAAWEQQAGAKTQIVCTAISD